MADALIEQTDIHCVLCGRPLGHMPEDQPDWPTGPICGDCYQAQQAEDELWAAEMNDGR